MTLTDEQITPDVLDDEAQRTPAWEDMRDREKRVGTCPRGQFDAHIREVAIVKRRDTGAHVLRVIVRTTGMGGRDALTWQGLSENPDDPFDLSEGQIKSLRKFADRLGILTPCPTPDVVSALTEMAHNGEIVQVRITHTPVGQQATLSRETGKVEILPAQTSATDLEGAARDAYQAHEKVVQGVRAARFGLACAAEGCHELHRTEGWRALGFGTLSEYLASPDVEISRTDFYRLAKIHQAYVLDGGVQVRQLEGAEPTKLEVPLSAIAQGVVTAEQAVADATSMPRRDLRARYAELLGADGDASQNGAVESRRRDGDGASVPVDVARTLVNVLQRVLDEVGDPAQKRMSRSLREVVQEALALAHEHALNEEEGR